jgi:hypothetical protein
MDKTVHRNCACIQLAFSAYRTQLTGKQSTVFERALNSGLEKTLRLNIYFGFVRDFFL